MTRFLILLAACLIAATFEYDLDGRLLASFAPDGQRIAATYTASGQIATQTDSRGITKYSYDPNDRLTRQDNPDGSFLAYAYDPNGNLAERSTPSGTVHYAWDGLNRMAGVTASDGKTTRYQGARVRGARVSSNNTTFH